MADIGEMQQALATGMAGAGGGPDVALILLGELRPSPEDFDALRDAILSSHNDRTDRSAWGALDEQAEAFWKAGDLDDARRRQELLELVERARIAVARIRHVTS